MSKTTTKWLNINIINETPTGLINGSNSTFSISQTPYPGSADLYLNGIYQRPVTDYTIIGTSVLMVNAPATGQDLHIKYWEQV